MPGADKRDIVNNEDIIWRPQLKIGLFFEKFDVFSFCYGSVLLHILFFRDLTRLVNFYTPGFLVLSGGIEVI